MRNEEARAPESSVMHEYTEDDARRDLGILSEGADAAAADRVRRHIDELRARMESAEHVCEAAVEVAAPTVKRDLMQQRQTRFLRALAEWRETRR